jgi:hypothetical protein
MAGCCGHLCCCPLLPHRVPPSDPILGSYMSDSCTPQASDSPATGAGVSSPKGTKLEPSRGPQQASAPVPQALKAPPGGWGMCSGTCQAGTCTLDCTKPQCCSPVNPNFKIAPHSSQASHDSDLTMHSGMPETGASGSAGADTIKGFEAAAAAAGVPVPVLAAGPDGEFAPGVPFPVGAVVVSPVAQTDAAAGTAGGMREEMPVAAAEPQPEELLCWGA